MKISYELIFFLLPKKYLSMIEDGNCEQILSRIRPFSCRNSCFQTIFERVRVISVHAKAFEAQKTLEN